MKRCWILLFWLFASTASAQLQIQSAHWQVIGGGPWCDAGRQVAEVCNGKNYCQIYVDPRYLCGGDPAVGRAKTLNVTYTCAGREQPVRAFPDGAQAVLKCNSGAITNPPPPVIAAPVPPPPVYPANPGNYGNSGNSGNYGTHGSNGRLQVFSARWAVIGGGASCDATDQLARACNGKSFCRTMVDAQHLCDGDPALNQKKRLEIRYACNGERQLSASFTDFSEAVLRCGDARDNGYAGGVIVTPSDNHVPDYRPPVVQGPEYRSGVTVHSARWEAVGGGGWCDATRQMVNACNGKNYCQVPVDARYLCKGDPARGRNKSLLITYSCHGKLQAPIAYPDFAQAVLRCDGQVNTPVIGSGRSATIKIRSATWAQVSGNAWCDATEQLVDTCDGKNRCSIRVDADHLCDGDPALNKLKNLEVQYSCSGRGRITKRFPDFANAVISCD